MLLLISMVGDWHHFDNKDDGDDDTDIDHGNDGNDKDIDNENENYKDNESQLTKTVTSIYSTNYTQPYDQQIYMHACVA